METHLFYTITRSEKAGAQYHIEQLLGHFNDRFELSLAVGEPGYLSDKARSLGIKTYIIPSLMRAVRPHHDRTAYLALKRLFADTRPDLVHSHSFKAGVLSRLAASRLEIPNVFTAHGWSFADGTPLPQRLLGIIAERYLARRTDRIITVSDADEALAIRRKISKREKFVTIPNALPDIEVPNRVPGRVPRLICVARLAYQKNHDCMLEAVAKIDIPFRLLILGTGSRKGALERIIRNRNLQDRVEIKADFADVNRYLSHADIFVLSSRWEGLSISILEAMRAALPVVATEVGGNVDAVVHGHTGILTPPNDPAKLASAIEMLLSDRKKATEMGKAARKRFLQLYTSDKMLTATDCVYQQLLK